MLQNGCRSGVGQTLLLFISTPRVKASGPTCTAAGSDGIAGLQRMTPLDSLAALRTAADRNIKPPYPSAPHDFFLILWFDPLHR
ncbi:MAG: hypothetical protein DMG57_14060 [Acidobacteria bacterium]|nr:MAG: hypothetical protein DMG57_14060 [Acidobacteriota bacterium]